MTTDPTPAQASDHVARAVLEYGRAWMMAPTTAACAESLGLPPGFALWVLGRAGALGDPGHGAAAAAIAFMAPPAVEAHWRSCPDTLSPRDVAEAYAGAAADFGRAELADLDATMLGRTAELAERVAAAGLPSIGVLFAAWRDMPSPRDPAGRVTVALQVLREMRGGAHISAVHAVGLGPHGAIMSVDDPVRGGVAGAERFGWEGPHPEPDVAARADAEEMTTRICAPAFAGLDAAERAELVDNVLAVRAALD